MRNLQNIFEYKRLSKSAKEGYGFINGAQFGCLLWEYLIGAHFGDNVKMSWNEDTPKTVTVQFSEVQYSSDKEQIIQQTEVLPKSNTGYVDDEAVKFFKSVDTDTSNGSIKEFTLWMLNSLETHRFPEEMYGDEALFFKSDQAHTDVMIRKNGKLQCQIHAKWNVDHGERTYSLSSSMNGNREYGIQNLIPSVHLTQQYQEALGFDRIPFTTEAMVNSKYMKRLQRDCKRGPYVDFEEVFKKFTPTLYSVRTQKYPGLNPDGFAFSKKEIMAYAWEFFDSRQGKEALKKYYQQRFNTKNTGTNYLLYGRPPTEKEIENGNFDIEIEFIKLDGKALSNLIQDSSFEVAESELRMMHPKYGHLCSFYFDARKASRPRGSATQERSSKNFHQISLARQAKESNDPDEINRALDALVEPLSAAKTDKEKGALTGLYIALQKKLETLEENKKYSLKYRLLGR